MATFKEGFAYMGAGAGITLGLLGISFGVGSNEQPSEEDVRRGPAGLPTLIDRGSYVLKDSGPDFLDAVPDPHFDPQGVKKKAVHDLFLAGCDNQAPKIVTTHQGIQVVSFKINRDPATGASKVRDCMGKLAPPAPTK